MKRAMLPNSQMFTKPGKSSLAPLAILGICVVHC
jgi:hypothetical protein